MNIRCDICGGELVMLAGGKGAACKNCGMEHSVERIREMLGMTGEVSVQKEEKKKTIPEKAPVTSEKEASKEPAVNEPEVIEIQEESVEPDTEEIFDIDDFEIVEDDAEELQEETEESDSDDDDEDDDEYDIEYDEDLTESSESDFVIKKGFLGSSKLTGYRGNADRVIFPKNITEINGSGIFSDRDEIVEIIFTGGISTTEGREFANCRNLKRIICKGGMLVAEETFAGCENLEEVYIISENDEDIVQLADEAFAGCEKLRIFHIDKKCRIEMYQNVFKDCKSLKKFVYPKRNAGFVYIGIKSGTFENCINLEKVVLPEQPECIYKHAFRNCVNLRKVVCHDGSVFDGSGAAIHPKAFENAPFQPAKSGVCPKCSKKLKCSGSNGIDSMSCICGFEVCEF